MWFFLSWNICIFPKGLTYGFGQKLVFSSEVVFFLENVKIYIKFDDVLKRKQGFLDHKNVILINLKIAILPKGLTLGFFKHWHFLQKMFCYSKPQDR